MILRKIRQLKTFLVELQPVIISLTEMLKNKKMKSKLDQRLNQNGKPTANSS